MAFTKEQLRNIESTLTLWLVTYRPEEEIRKQLDLGYTIKGQDIFLEEIRPVYLKPSEIGRYPFAKIKFERKTQNSGKSTGCKAISNGIPMTQNQ